MNPDKDDTIKESGSLWWLSLTGLLLLFMLMLNFNGSIERACEFYAGKIYHYPACEIKYKDFKMSGILEVESTIKERAHAFQYEDVYILEIDGIITASGPIVTGSDQEAQVEAWSKRADKAIKKYEALGAAVKWDSTAAVVKRTKRGDGK